MAMNVGRFVRTPLLEAETSMRCRLSACAATSGSQRRTRIRVRRIRATSAMLCSIVAVSGFRAQAQPYATAQSEGGPPSDVRVPLQSPAPAAATVPIPLTPPATGPLSPSLSTGGKVRIQVEGAGQRYQVQIEAGGRTFLCNDVTVEKPCVLTDLPQGPGLVRVSGSGSFVKDVGITDWPTRVRLDRAGYGPLIAGLLVGGLGVALMLETQTGSIAYSAGAGFVAGGTTMVVWDIGRNHDVVSVEADSLARWAGRAVRGPGWSWRFSF